MVRMLSRLLVAIAIALAAPVVCASLVVFICELTTWRLDFEVLLASNFITAALFVAAWVAIWRSCVAWTALRRWLTAASVLWSIGVAFVLGLLLALVSNEEEVGVVFGGLFWIVTWLASTALVWRETDAERTDRLGLTAKGVIHCPHCGYNMTGLSEARCPECGTQYTLNELFATLTEQSSDLGVH